MWLKFVKFCYHCLRSIWKIRQFLTKAATKTLVHATVISKLNYCNSLLYGIINQYLIAKLQRVQNAAARLIMRCHRTIHASPILKELHWLPIKDRIIFSVIVNVFKALHGQSPQYIRNLLCYEEKTRFTHSRGKSLLKILKRNNKTYGIRSFSCAGPYEWNRLPLYLRQKETLKDFKKDLKTYLFSKSYQ